MKNNDLAEMLSSTKLVGIKEGKEETIAKIEEEWHWKVQKMMEYCNDGRIAGLAEADRLFKEIMIEIKRN